MQVFMYNENAGHMTKLAAMPIYGKNTFKSSLHEPVGRFRRNVVFNNI